MHYVSTRGAGAVTPSTALVNGIAPDGGLYVPDAFPKVDSESWLELSYEQILKKVLHLFFTDIDSAVLNQAAEQSTALFRHSETVPAVKVADGLFALELFHGPTYAFKDIALTILPFLLQSAAASKGLTRVAVLTATSGDTGSAAMSGFSGVTGTEMLVFYPAKGISEIQRRQMVCQSGKNLFAYALDGNFDDAQRAVKAIFTDSEIRREALFAGIVLSSANSINIGRLFPQMSYYISTWCQLMQCGALDKNGVFDVTVPTGNFGNILAAFYARKMGIPIRRLITASNENHVVADFMCKGTYDRRQTFKITNSPSMDILVSSNMERLLFELGGRQAKRVSECMENLAQHGVYTLNVDEKKKLDQTFSAGWVNADETEAEIRRLWQENGYLADPHTAVGFQTAKTFQTAGVPMVVAATASPWKFPSVMVRALNGESSGSDFDDLRLLAASTGLPTGLAELENAKIYTDGACSRETVADTVRSVFQF